MAEGWARRPNGDVLEPSSAQRSKLVDELAHAAQGVGVHRCLVPAHKNAERRGIPEAGASHQFSIADCQAPAPCTRVRGPNAVRPMAHAPRVMKDVTYYSCIRRALSLAGAARLPAYR